MRPEELKEKILNLRTWKQRDVWAPHKPLLLLVRISGSGFYGHMNTVVLSVDV